MDELAAARLAARSAASERDRLFCELRSARAALRAIWHFVEPDDGGPCTSEAYQGAIDLVKKEKVEE